LFCVGFGHGLDGWYGLTRIILIVDSWGLRAKCLKGYLFFSRKDAKAQSFVLGWFWPRIGRMVRINADYFLVYSWGLRAKCLKGYLFFSRKDAKAQSFVLGWFWPRIGRMEGVNADYFNS